MMRQRNLARVVGKLRGEPWAILPGKLDDLVDLVEAHARGERDLVAAANALGMGSGEEPEEQGYAVVDRVAVVPLHGVIGKRLSWLEILCGGCDVDVFLETLATAASERGVEGVIIDIDSPGGMCVGTPELAAAVRELSETMPVVAYTEREMFSAAYWIGCHAGQVLAAPSAGVGSVGVIWKGWDDSARYAELGVTAEVFASGRVKDLNSPGVPWRAEHREFMRATVDGLAGQFEAAVRENREAVDDEVFSSAGFWFGPEKLTMGLVDGFADRLGDVIEMMNEELGR